MEYSLTGLSASPLSTVRALDAWPTGHHAEIRRDQAACGAAGKSR